MNEVQDCLPPGLAPFYRDSFETRLVLTCPLSCYKSCQWWTLGRWGRNTRAAVAKTWHENFPIGGIMPWPNSGSQVRWGYGGLEVLMCCWHAAYQVPVGKVAMWPVWAGFEHFLDGVPGRSILIPLSNQGHKTQLLYTPWLVLGRKRVLEPIPCFLSQEYASFCLRNHKQNICVGCQGNERALLGRILPKKMESHGFSWQTPWGTSCLASMYISIHTQGLGP